MTTSLAQVLWHVQRWHPCGGDAPDRLLLERFVRQRDEAAFAALVARYSAMVLRQCRRVLGDAHAAEDAFQAVFVILARKAGSIRQPEALPGWLHGVARRVALKARTRTTARPPAEALPGDALPDPRPDPLTQLSARELLDILDEEVQRLPSNQRSPVLLCCLQGRTQEEAARILDCSPGAIKGRLERGRRSLQQRLKRRGIALSAALAVAGISNTAAPAMLQRSAAQAALGKAGDSAVALAESVLNGMHVSKLTGVAGLLVMLALAAPGAIAWNLRSSAEQAPEEKVPIAPSIPREKETRQPNVRTDLHGDPLPDGVIARLGTLRLRANGAMLAFPPGGTTIVSVLRGRQVTFWDADTGKPRGRRELPVQPVYVIFLSSDGRLLAVKEPALDSPIDIWDITSGKRVRRLQPPQGQGFYRAAISPNDKTLAVTEYGPMQGVIRIWDVASGEQRVLKGPGGMFDSLAFSPDGKLLAASNSHCVVCWNVARGEQLWRLGGAHERALSFTPDGRTVIASPGNRERSWHAWDAATGKPAEGLKLPEGYNYAHLAVAPDGRTLVFAQHRGVAGADYRVRLWDLRTGRLLQTLPTQGQIGPFAPDGKSFLTNDGALQRWELATGRPMLPDTDALGHRGEVGRAVYSPDGRRLASSAGDGTIRLWDIATAKLLHILRGHEREATGLDFTPDGKYLVSGSTEGELRVWDSEAGKVIRRIPLHDPKLGEKKQHVWRLHVMPDGQTAIVLGYDPWGGGGGDMNGILTTWDLASGRRKSTAADKGSDGFYSAFSTDGRTLASHGELLDTSTGKLRVKLEGGRTSLPHYAFSSDGRLVAGLVTRTENDGMRMTSKTDRIWIWDTASGRTLRRLSTDAVGDVAFSPDGRYLASGHLSGLRLWEVATGQLVLRHKAHEQMRGIYGDSFTSCLSFAPDGRTLATGHPDSTVLIWSAVPSISPATTADLSRLWEDLAGSDAVLAYAAHWRLAQAGDSTLQFLRKQLQPEKAASAEETRSLLADLDSGEFRRREAAAARLRELGSRAAGAMRAALKSGPTLETRRRIEEVLKALDEPPTGQTLRVVRAVAVLERIGTAEARALLKELAGGDSEARMTREAKGSLERLANRRR